jgi:hypothetical protein
MSVVSCRILGAAALLSLAVAAPAFAQDNPPQAGWVDPPTELAPSADPPADSPTGSLGPVDAPSSRAGEPDLERPPRAPRESASPPRSAGPERAAPRADLPARIDDPDRAAPRPRAPTAAGRPEPAPPRSARPVEERAAPRRPAAQEATAPRFPQRQQSAQARVAKELAIDYLDFWSDPNAVALDAHGQFYAPTIRYHGRDVSARALQEEKRRFARRWPDREYRPRLDTMRTSCAGAFCTIRSTFDYRAADPNRGRSASGTGILELGVSFAGGAPVIVSETSAVVRRGSGDRTVSLEEAED